MNRGSKYDPLRDHLLRRGQPRLTLAISEIEELLGFELCKSAAAPSWWANTKSNAGRAQRHAWRDAGYDAFLTADGEAVEFNQATTNPKREKAPRRGAFADHRRRRETKAST